MLHKNHRKFTTLVLPLPCKSCIVMTSLFTSNTSLAILRSTYATELNSSRTVLVRTVIQRCEIYAAYDAAYLDMPLAEISWNCAVYNESYTQKTYGDPPIMAHRVYIIYNAVSVCVKPMTGDRFYRLIKSDVKIRPFVYDTRPIKSADFIVRLSSIYTWWCVNIDKMISKANENWPLHQCSVTYDSTLISSDLSKPEEQLYTLYTSNSTDNTRT